MKRARDLFEYLAYCLAFDRLADDSKNNLFNFAIKLFDHPCLVIMVAETTDGISKLVKQRLHLLSTAIICLVRFLRQRHHIVMIIDPRSQLGYKINKKNFS